MNLELARAELESAAGNGVSFVAARTVLIDRGREAFGAPADGAHTIDEILRIAVAAPPSPARRDFAVLLIHALGIDGLLPTRGTAEAAIRSFLEAALLNPLRRAGYPFDGTHYDKRRALAGLHATIDEHLRPLEPSIPRWIHGAVHPGEQ